MDVCIARIFEEEKEGSHGQRIQRLPKTRAKDLNDPKRRPAAPPENAGTRGRSAPLAFAARFNRRGPHGQGGYRGLRQLGALRAEGGAAPCNP